MKAAAVKAIAALARETPSDVVARAFGTASEENARRAQEIVRERRADCLKEARDYSWETVMSHSSHIEHLLAARQAGYTATMLYVATEDPRVSIGRVAERVGAGGHDVPEDRVAKRWRRSIGLLPRALLIVHRARIFDNGSESRPFKLVASLDHEVFETSVPLEKLPIWFRPTVAEMYRHQA